MSMIDADTPPPGFMARCPECDHLLCGFCGEYYEGAIGTKVRNLGDVRWVATEDGSVGKGTGRHIACFILDTPST